MIYKLYLENYKTNYHTHLKVQLIPLTETICESTKEILIMKSQNMTGYVPGYDVGFYQVTGHVCGHVTGHVSSHVTGHVSSHVTGHV